MGGSINEHHCRRVAGGPFDLRGTLAGPTVPLPPRLFPRIPQDPRSKDLSVLLPLPPSWAHFPSLPPSLKINARLTNIFPSPSVSSTAFRFSHPLPVSSPARADYFYLWDPHPPPHRILSLSLSSLSLSPSPSLSPSLPPSWPRQRARTVRLFKTSEHLYR